MKLVIGNFKMNLLKKDIDNYLNEFKDKKYQNVIFCPSYIYLNDFINKGYSVGSQDLSNMDNGAYTGEVSSSQLKSLGVEYSIIGHSERRQYHNDSKLVNDKLKKCFSNDIVPILCIGETKEEYENGKTLDILRNEIDEAFNNIDNFKDLIIAYEPIWAIGTGLVPSNEIIFNTIDYIKKYIQDEYKFNFRVLYGGSVSNKNIEELEKISNIDGYLVGGCSTKANEFIQLIEFVNMK